MPDPDREEQARQLLRAALHEQRSKRYESAVRLYKRSLNRYPTAEAHTFLGWAYSFMGRLDEAISECRRAIGIDPTFGNPYNDIGSYLMKLGRFQEAIAWLEKAKNAPRYEPRHYPYLNLARAYAALGRYHDACREMSQAQFIHEEVVENGQDRFPEGGETIH
ncbi:MAG: tetratricopeptide repeat protein [Acidobacteriota bacterium]